MGSQARRLSFTLVELLVVIAILGILAALLLPALSSARAISQRTVCQSNLRQLGVAFAGYTADTDGTLPWSWNQIKDLTLTNNSCTGYFAFPFNYSINGTGWPASPTSGFPYNSAEFGLSYYPYLNNDAVFNCPIQLQIQYKYATFQPMARYVNVCNNGGALVYNHYRQNPYFGHMGHGSGNLIEIPCVGCGGANFANTYPISGRLNLIRKPESTVLNFDVSPWRFNRAEVGSPACGDSVYVGGADGDRTYLYNYTVPSKFPNIGFIHGTAGSATRYVGNFSYVDGHVGTMTSDILTDTTDYVFLLKK